MGGHWRHHHDVCGADQRLHRKKGTTRLDKFCDAHCFLLFAGRDADQQLTIFLAGKSFRERRMVRYRKLVGATAIFGVVFMLLQFLGFRHIWLTGITLHGSGAGQFLYIIAGLHGLHVFGGVIALLTLW